MGRGEEGRCESGPPSFCWPLSSVPLFLPGDIPGMFFVIMSTTGAAMGLTALSTFGTADMTSPMMPASRWDMPSATRAAVTPAGVVLLSSGVAGACSCSCSWPCAGCCCLSPPPMRPETIGAALSSFGAALMSSGRALMSSGRKASRVRPAWRAIRSTSPISSASTRRASTLLREASRRLASSGSSCSSSIHGKATSVFSGTGRGFSCGSTVCWIWSRPEAASRRKSSRL